MTVSKRLIISSMVLIISVLAITTVLIITSVNRQFNQYVSSDFLAGMDSIYEDISSILLEGTFEDLDTIGSSAVTEGYFVEVLSEKGDMQYASQNMAATNMMGRSISLLQMENMPMYSGMEVKSWVIETRGTAYLLNIGYLVGDGLSEDAQRFKTSVYLGVAMALITGIGLAYIGSRIMAKPMIKDMRSLKEGVESIQDGQLQHRFETGSSVVEIQALKDSINDMASTLLVQEELRKELVATVSHEVKTPLTVLKSQIDAFIDGIYEPSPERLSKCRDEILRLEVLLENMDNFEAFSASQHVLNLSDFSMKEELEALSVILKPQFDKKDLVLRLCVEDDSLIHTDRYKLRQVIYNLLSNAYKFSDEGTEVVVTGIVNSNDLILEVKNQGLIIKDQDQGAIFEPRFRAPNANMKDPHGKGLGLHISKTLFEALGGEMRLLGSDEVETVFQLVLYDAMIADR